MRDSNPISLFLTSCQYIFPFVATEWILRRASLSNWPLTPAFAPAASRCGWCENHARHTYLWVDGCERLSVLFGVCSTLTRWLPVSSWLMLPWLSPLPAWNTPDSRCEFEDNWPDWRHVSFDTFAAWSSAHYQETVRSRLEWVCRDNRQGAAASLSSQQTWLHGLSERTVGQQGLTLRLSLFRSLLPWCATLDFEAMCGVGGMRYASERPVHHALRLSCNGRLLVLPWSPACRRFAAVCREDSIGSGQNCSVSKWYLADRRTRCLHEDSVGRREPRT